MRRKKENAQEKIVPFDEFSLSNTFDAFKVNGIFWQLNNFYDFSTTLILARASMYVYKYVCHFIKMEYHKDWKRGISLISLDKNIYENPFQLNEFQRVF